MYNASSEFSSGKPAGHSFSNKVVSIRQEMSHPELRSSAAGAGDHSRRRWLINNGYLNTSNTLKKQTNDIIIYKHTQSPFIHLCFSCWYFKDNSLNNSSFLGNIRFIIIVRITKGTKKTMAIPLVSFKP